MTAADLMTADRSPVRPQETIGAVVDRLLGTSCGILPVVDAEDRLLGLLSAADVLRLMLPGYLASMEDYSFIPDTVGDDRVHFSAVAPLPVSAAARLEPDAVVEATDPLIEVIRVLARCDTDCLPVVSRGKLVGTVTRTEVLGALVAHDGTAGAPS